MILKTILNIVLTILILSAGTLLAFLFFFPEGAILTVQAPPTTPTPLTPAEPEPMVEADADEPAIPPKTLEKMFHIPVVKQRREPSPVEEEPEAPHSYDTTRLTYLGFIVSEGQKKFLIKDTLYEDVFRIGLGEEVFGFSLNEEGIEGGSLILQDGEKLYRVLIK